MQILRVAQYIFAGDEVKQCCLSSAISSNDDPLFAFPNSPVELVKYTNWAIPQMPYRYRILEYIHATSFKCSFNWSGVYCKYALVPSHVTVTDTIGTTITASWKLYGHILKLHQGLSALNLTTDDHDAMKIPLWSRPRVIQTSQVTTICATGVRERKLASAWESWQTKVLRQCFQLNPYPLIPTIWYIHPKINMDTI